MGRTHCINQSKQQARQQGYILGKRNEYAHKNKQGQLWQAAFKTIERIYHILDIIQNSGCKVLSRFLRPSQAASLLTPFS